MHLLPKKIDTVMPHVVQQGGSLAFGLVLEVEQAAAAWSAQRQALDADDGHRLRAAVA